VRRLPWALRTALIWLAGVALLAALTGIVFAALYKGPDQPVPFSHRLHVTDKQLSCFFCHPNAMNSNNPGMPPLEKCLLCHNVIVPKFSPVAKLHDYYNKGKSIRWVRVNGVPDFVHFSHQAHLASRIDCGACHGNIKAMDRVTVVNKFDMDFCLKCHWKMGANASCYTCHY
jgi:hypothetical protein